MGKIRLVIYRFYDKGKTIHKIKPFRELSDRVLFDYEDLSTFIKWKLGQYSDLQGDYRGYHDIITDNVRKRYYTNIPELIQFSRTAKSGEERIWYDKINEHPLFKVEILSDEEPRNITHPIQPHNIDFIRKWQTIIEFSVAMLFILATYLILGSYVPEIVLYFED